VRKSPFSKFVLLRVVNVYVYRYNEATRNAMITAPRRGCHLVQDSVDSALGPAARSAASQKKPGLVNLLLRHTSASLTVNENADPTAGLLTSLPGGVRLVTGHTGCHELSSLTVRPSRVVASLPGVRLFTGCHHLDVF
jgi:hypothetical protein